jgi:hypothetical protein
MRFGLKSRLLFTKLQLQTEPYIICDFLFNKK